MYLSFPVLLNLPWQRIPLGRGRVRTTFLQNQAVRTASSSPIFIAQQIRWNAIVHAHEFACSSSSIDSESSFDSFLEQD
jgi:hypothetical protein